MKLHNNINFKNKFLFYTHKMTYFPIINMITIFIIAASIIILLLIYRQIKYHNFVEIITNEITTYIYDNFPLKKYIVKFIAKCNEFTKDNPNWNKAFRGKDGWLFLGNDYNRTIDALRGVDVDGPARRHHLGLIHSLADNCRKADIPFMVVIGPNKSTIYPEYLPDWLHPMNSGIRDTLKASLEQNGIPVFDPTALLRASKGERLLYYRTDTHWNIAAGSIVYTGLKKFINSHFQLNWPSLPSYRLANGPIYKGDLVNIGNFPYTSLKKGDNFQLIFENKSLLHRYSDDGISQYLAKVAMNILFRCKTSSTFQRNETLVNNFHNHIDIIENSMPISQKTIVIFGDSFVAAISPFFNNIFKKIIYISRYDADLWSVELLKYLHPEIVIFLCVERCFIYG